jgi:NAD+ diphosphatase
MSRDQGYWFAFRGSELLVRMEGNAAQVPRGAEWTALGLAAGGLTGGEPHAVGEIGGEPAWAVELDKDTEPPEGMAFQGLRRLWGVLDEAAWRVAGRAFQIVEWDRTHRFCGRCGTATERHATERVRTCPQCGLQQYPRVSPAVITLIEDGDRLLLARSPHFVKGVYSTLAGFVEPGESLEETVAREVREEVGVELADIRYFGSQPWPFPHSMMIGFTARYAGGEIVPQEGEIEDARWFTVDTLPLLPPPLSIARALIDDFLRRHPPPGTACARR